ncbi:beta-lactamase family protein [Streptomyces sp. ISL-98]|uniref:serine hydrolase domain-containing protein n=1 Tax=Streptomyces sp. ISL-98 TaxID=2819192 RepID=UPI001BEC9690|nr:serine hydrolase domain-containing protein [Streptomyces sp. ISL-98]MBT2509693.1 beta-lactamase family protein [Streptomyces sp. ISL-98]
MKPRTRPIATALLLSLAAAPLATAPAAPAFAFAESPSAVATAHGPNTDALRKAIAGLPDEDATAALVRVAGTDGTWRGSAGVADLATGGKAIDDGRFRAGSVTKVFTAAVVLQLAAERKVNLNRPVQTYLPGLLPRTFKPVTVRQLLNHTSGIQAADGPGDTFEELYAHRFDTVDPRDQIANAAAKGPEFKPGTKQHYLNINYTVLGLLIEKLTHTSYEQAVGDRILAPLALRHTSFPGSDPKIHGPHNRGYQRVEKADGTAELRDVTEWNSSDRWAAGDIVSTTANLERFTLALFRGRVVPQAQLEEMFTVPKVKDAESGEDAQLTAGLSRLVLPDGTVAWGKTGGRYGYNTAIGGTRDVSRTLVYCVNATDAKGEGMNPVALDIVFAAFSDRSN